MSRLFQLAAMTLLSGCLATDALAQSCGAESPPMVRLRITVAYAKMYALVDELMAVPSMYKTLTRDNESYRNLVTIQRYLSFTRQTLDNTIKSLEAVNDVAQPDASAHEIAQELLKEVDQFEKAHQGALASALEWRETLSDLPGLDLRQSMMLRAEVSGPVSVLESLDISQIAHHARFLEAITNPRVFTAPSKQ